MHLAFCIDESYACHLATLFVSLKEHQHRSVVAHILSAPLSSDTQEKLANMQYNGFEIRFYPLSADDFDGFPISMRYNNRLSVATYYRIALPRILPDDIGRVLYLDADMLALADLSPLWSMDMVDHCTLAVSDGSLTAQQRWETLGLSRPLYFNAGMMLMNLDVWRSAGIEQRVVELLQVKSDWDYNDQDVLNIALNHSVKLIDSSWNAQSFDVHNNHIKDAKIIHFTGAEKPWNKGCVHPYTEAYIYARNQSAYSPFTPGIFLDAQDQQIMQKMERQLKPKDRIAIFGAGQKGRRLLHAIAEKFPEVLIDCLLDNHQQGHYQEWPIYRSLPRHGVDYVVVASLAFYDEIYQQLVLWGLPEERIL